MVGSGVAVQNVKAWPMRVQAWHCRLSVGHSGEFALGVWHRATSPLEFCGVMKSMCRSPEHSLALGPYFLHVAVPPICVPEKWPQHTCICEVLQSSGPSQLMV